MIAFVIISILFAWSLIVSLLLRYNRDHVTIAVSHMNRITSSILEHNEVAVKKFLATSGKANFVLPNGCIIVAKRHGNVRNLFMLDNRPSEPKRFVSSAEFNELGLTVPDCKGLAVRIYMRHGQAAHNLTAPELQQLWDTMSVEDRTKYTSRATLRIPENEIWSLGPNRMMFLTLQELRYDAPLTKKGCEEAIQASERLYTYLQEHHPHAHVHVDASELLRSYETGALLLDAWKRMGCSFSFDTTVYASHAFLNELHREIGSAVHMLGTAGRLVAESLELGWREYAQYILKTPLSPDSMSAMTLVEQIKARDDVVHITSENTPMFRENRPLSLYGVTVKHVVSDNFCPEYDLFTIG